MSIKLAARSSVMWLLLFHFIAFLTFLFFLLAPPKCWS